jgi:hypothetical protein
MVKRNEPFDPVEWEDKEDNNLAQKLKNYSELTTNISKLSEVYKKRMDIISPRGNFRKTQDWIMSGERAKEKRMCEGSEKKK